MIIQCDHCSAKFRIDDAKLANGAVKVRCAKCKEVFVVAKEDPPAETVLTSQPVVTPSPAVMPAAALSESFGGPSDFSLKQEQLPDNYAAEIKAPATDEFDWQDTSVSLDLPESMAELDDATFKSKTDLKNTLQAEAAAADADNDFDFGDINLQSESAEAKPSSPTLSQEDFSIDFGEVSFAEPQQPPSSPDGSFSGTLSSGFSFDASPEDASSQLAGNDDFMLSFDNDQLDEAKAPELPVNEEAKVDFGDFSFSVKADTAKSDQDSAREFMSLPGQDFEVAPFSSSSDEELVPTSLLSRKKSASRFPLFLILGAILLIVALAGSGVYFFGGPKAFSRVGLGFLVDWYGDRSAEEGSMAIKNTLSSYVSNNSAGELFVVRGEVLNNFKSSRASVQVKVSILGSGGTVLLSKNAYCGNSLSSEQLSSLPLAKIEEAMNNQFGDSLVNLGVKPGSVIPFVVVMSAVPKEATDYSVQIVGSTVATQ